MKLNNKRGNSHLYFEKSIRLQLKSKCSDERYLTPWMFLIWGIIGVSIIVGVVFFYSVKVESSGMEAKILDSRLISCLGNNFDYNQLITTNFNIYEKCGLNADLFEPSGSQNFYYINVSIKEDSGKSFEIIKGIGILGVQCGYQKDKKELEKNFAQCAESFTNVIGADGKNYNVNILVASNQK